MTIYFFTLLMIILFGIILDAKQQVEFGSGKFSSISSTSRKTFLILVYLILFVISAFRSYNIGNDTFAYYLNYLRIGNIKDFSQVLLSVKNESGYLLSQWILAKNNLSFQIALVLATSLNLFSVFLLISKQSTNPLISVIVYLGLGYFTFQMTALRQSIALSLCILAYLKSRDGNPILFIVFLLLASSFHISALIFLPGYFVNRLKINKKTIILIFITLIFLVVYRVQITQFLIEVSGRQYDTIQTGGTLYIIMLIISLIAGLALSHRNLTQDPIFRNLFFLVSLSLLLIPIATYHPAFFRVHYYYSIYLVIYIPRLFNYAVRKREVFLVEFIVIVLLSVRFLQDLYLNPAFSNYGFFW